MKIYFEDGQLLPQSMLQFKFDHQIDASEGYSYCEDALRWIDKNDPEGTVYTNMVTALSNSYTWNNELGAPEIYMRDNSKKFVRIDELYGGRIRVSQNVMAMYRSGLFGNILRSDEDETLD